VVKQLSFLRDTDGEKTKEAVEAALETYRIYVDGSGRIPATRDANVLSRAAKQHECFSFIYRERGNQKADFERERDEYMERICRAVNRLNKMERKLIIKRYMCFEEPRDYDVYNEMGISESTFYRVREKAFYKLVFALRIEVYKEGAPV
jgi:ArpU family phage transcriptional regulator